MSVHDAPRPLVSLAEARHILDGVGAPIERTKQVALHHAAGRVLAADLEAGVDVPPMDRSAMDGFAVRAGDTRLAAAAHPVALRVVDASWAGHPASAAVAAGTCIAIATGGQLPEGADAVVMVEHTTRDGDIVRLHGPAEPGQHIARRGGDLARGAVVLRAGTLLTPARVGVVAALGHLDVAIYARPRVAILATGDEVVSPGGTLGPGQVFDVNTSTLGAVVLANGGEPVAHQAVGDDRHALDAAFERCLGADLVLVSGGSSVGERDYVLDLLTTRGEVLFAGIALKPGKPTVLARVEGRPVFGMPGNPTSCLSNGYLLVAPLLRRLARLPPRRPQTVRARLSAAVSSPRGRHQFYTVRLVNGAAVPAFKGSGEITSMAGADGYFEIPVERVRVDAGEEVEVVLFDS